MCERDAGLESSETDEPEDRHGRGGVDAQRPDDFELLAEAEARGHDADDLMRTSVDRESARQRFGIATELALPVAVGEHDRGRTVSGVLRSREPSSVGWRYSECREQTAARRQRSHLFWVALTGDRRRGGRNPNADI